MKTAFIVILLAVAAALPAAAQQSTPVQPAPVPWQRTHEQQLEMDLLQARIEIAALQKDLDRSQLQIRILQNFITKNDPQQQADEQAIRDAQDAFYSEAKAELQRRLATKK